MTMTVDEIQQIVDRAYPLIQKYYGKGSKPTPPVELHKDIYARLSGIEDMEGEASRTTKAEYDDKENKIFIYYPNMKSEEDVLRSLIHEYTHYTQDSTLFKRYKQIYSYDEDPTEIEAHKNEENWEMFSQK